MLKMAVRLQRERGRGCWGCFDAGLALCVVHHGRYFGMHGGHGVVEGGGVDGAHPAATAWQTPSLAIETTTSVARKKTWGLMLWWGG